MQRIEIQAGVIERLNIDVSDVLYRLFRLLALEGVLNVLLTVVVTAFIATWGVRYGFYFDKCCPDIVGCDHCGPTTDSGILAIFSVFTLIARLVVPAGFVAVLVFGVLAAKLSKVRLGLLGLLFPQRITTGGDIFRAFDCVATGLVMGSTLNFQLEKMVDDPCDYIPGSDCDDVMSSMPGMRAFAIILFGLSLCGLLQNWVVLWVLRGVKISIKPEFEAFISVVPKEREQIPNPVPVAISATRV